MNAIAQRVTSAPAASVREMALRIAREAPTLADLTGEQLEQVARLVMADNLKNELAAAAAIAGIDYNAEKDTFLTRQNSEHTRRAYAAALDGLEKWAEAKRKSPLELSADEIDGFIYDMKAQGKAPATTRRNVAATSAFYSFLERSTDGKVKNNVLKTKQRPRSENKKDIIIPTEKDYKIIIAELPPVERAIVITLASRGLRAGALPTLELKGDKYIGKSKGKRLEENKTAGVTLPAEALAAIKAAGLDPKRPFAWKTKQGRDNSGNAIECRLNFQIEKIYRAGKIRARYSAHDFRHYFAVNEYKKNKDIFRLSKLLNHAGIQITQAYLKSLDVEL